ncbi:uncharacterized protein LOC132747163 [Ruditapes philippinarum]|uniref:uncharacterized protein LOC132747163 n=1 Tax=Ruditapes philippinarum TaxID=129788 RepID=UPI00295BE1DA|nr:uncharacterized protein LOC132747163 [Ruditapes philippinarum]XP_060592467.1 uncharacterized protein LOC132747163 [Ruditapes philippinarum]
MPKKRTTKAATEKGIKKPYSRSVDSGTSSAGSSTSQKRSANLTWFLKIYKGLDDWHLSIFKATQQCTKAKTVLYPGSDKHLTASLCFPDVTYVDCNKKLEPIFNDDKVLGWVHENKLYSEEAKIKFLCKNFESNFAKLASFDLMISACAGIVSKSCCKYVKSGGYFLVSDAHFDARATFLRQDFELEGVYDMETSKFLTGENDLAGHFHTKEGKPLTNTEVEESMQKPKARRSFKLQKEAMFYLFKKTK